MTVYHRVAYTLDSNVRVSNVVTSKHGHDVSEFPFSGLALAIRAGNGRNGDCDPLNGGEKVPVPADRGNDPRRAAMEYSRSCQGDTAC